MRLTRKLAGSLEGALAAGEDPATSPLYVFGPFLRLVVPAGVASVTYGASIWLAVLTVAAVSAVYLFYGGMSAARHARGEPSAEQDCLGRCLACSCPALGPPALAESP